MQGAAVGAHIELGRRAASEVLRGAICETVYGSSAPQELCEEDLLWVFRKLDRDKDSMLGHEDLRAGVRYISYFTFVFATAVMLMPKFPTTLYSPFLKATWHNLV